jgi:hypothetical protein
VGKFSLEIDFESQSHSAIADRAFIGVALDQAKQAVRSGSKMEGELKTPVVGVPDPVVIGHWKIELRPLNP